MYVYIYICKSVSIKSSHTGMEGAACGAGVSSPFFDTASLLYSFSLSVFFVWIHLSWMIEFFTFFVSFIASFVAQVFVLSCFLPHYFYYCLFPLWFSTHSQEHPWKKSSLFLVWYVLARGNWKLAMNTKGQGFASRMLAALIWFGNKKCLDQRVCESITL